MACKMERVGFRLFRLSKAQVGEITKLYPKAEVRPARGSSGGYVVSWWLQETETYDWLIDFLADAKLGHEDYGLFVSLRTDSDSDIIRVPQFALELSRRVGGVIDFSYTYIEQE
jgi:hypothetical protein